MRLQKRNKEGNYLKNLSTFYIKVSKVLKHGFLIVLFFEERGVV
tara:strand:- start:501 stop:632 length:132 start_codon:yes stop_codon:yes gene_type:complete